MFQRLIWGVNWIICWFGKTWHHLIKCRARLVYFPKKWKTKKLCLHGNPQTQVKFLIKMYRNDLKTGISFPSPAVAVQFTIPLSRIIGPKSIKWWKTGIVREGDCKAYLFRRTWGLICRAFLPGVAPVSRPPRVSAPHRRAIHPVLSQAFPVCNLTARPLKYTQTPERTFCAGSPSFTTLNPNLQSLTSTPSTPSYALHLLPHFSN